MKYEVFDGKIGAFKGQKEKYNFLSFWLMSRF